MKMTKTPSVPLRFFVLFVLLSMFAFASAYPAPSKTTPAPPKPTQSQCNTGPIQCCNSVESASSPSASSLLGLLGIVLSSVDVLVGITCSPISVIGIGGTSCSSQPVCCENNSFNGLIAIGCDPININL